MDSIIKMPDSDDYALVKDGKRGVMTSGGRLLIPIQYDGLKVAYNWFWLVEKDAKKGIYQITRQAGEVVPCVYDSIRLTYTMYDASFIVQENGKWGLCNDKKQVYLPIVYDKIEYAHSCYELEKGGITSCLFNEKVIVDSIQLKQAIRVPLPSGFGADYYHLVLKKGRKGILNDNGEITVPYQYDDIQYCVIWQLPERDNKTIPNHLLLVSKDGLWGMTDLNNREILPVKFTGIKVLDKGDVLLTDQEITRCYNLVTEEYQDK